MREGFASLKHLFLSLPPTSYESLGKVLSRVVCDQGLPLQTIPKWPCPFSSYSHQEEITEEMKCITDMKNLEN